MKLFIPEKYIYILFINYNILLTIIYLFLYLLSLFLFFEAVLEKTLSYIYSIPCSSSPVLWTPYSSINTVLLMPWWLGFKSLERLPCLCNSRCPAHNKYKNLTSLLFMYPESKRHFKLSCLVPYFTIWVFKTGPLIPLLVFGTHIQCQISC